MAGPQKISLKPEIPESLKADIAPTKWGKVLSVTPIILTVIATMLAGLSSSEMTKAQYDRSLAAQRQSKAGDQWNFFQGKRLRAVVLRTTLDTMLLTAGTRPLDRGAFQAALTGLPAAAGLDSPAAQAAFAALRDRSLPKAAERAPTAADVQAVLKALEETRPDEEISALLSQLSGNTLDETLRSHQAQALAFDEMLRPISQVIEQWETQLSGPAGEAIRRDYVMARMTYNALRYDAEARLNQTIAELFELQVRMSNLSAERHHRRSGRFFYGMLAAQLGVIISTFAMAAQKRNVLWAFAAGAGAVAIAFTVYVLVYV